MNPPDLSPTTQVAAAKANQLTCANGFAVRAVESTDWISRVRSIVCGAAILAVFASLTGCQLGFGRNGDANAPFWDTSNVQSPLTKNPLAMIEQADSKERRKQKLLMSGQGQKELAAAIDLYEKGNKGNAARLMKKISTRYSDSATGEEALYRYANIMYETNSLPKAQEAYGQLMEDYPSSRYMDDATGRLFKIARYWLDQTGKTPSSVILQASHEEEATAPPQRKSDPTLKLGLLPNFHDKTRPMFDTRGRALQALRSVWLGDPNSELADDSLMMTASHYLDKGDYVESDRYFQILRDDFPKSPHLEQAYLAGTKVKQMSYQGALYDVTPLKNAEKLTKNYLRIFPDSENRDKLRGELDRLQEAKAKYDWGMVEYYMKKNKPRAIATECQNVIENHPTSSYANKARQVLSRIDPKVIADLPLAIRPADDEPEIPYEDE